MEISDLSHSRAAKLIKHLALAAKRQESKHAARIEVKKGIENIKEVLERPVEKQKLNAVIERLESTMMRIIDQEKQIFSTQKDFNARFDQHLVNEGRHVSEEKEFRSSLTKELSVLEGKYKQLKKKYPKHMLKGIESKIRSSRLKLRKLKNKKKK